MMIHLSFLYYRLIKEKLSAKIFYNGKQLTRLLLKFSTRENGGRQKGAD